MDGEDVCLGIRLLSEGLPTQATLEGFLSCVTPHVHLHVGLLPNLVIAKLTEVDPCSEMSTQSSPDAPANSLDALKAHNMTASFTIYQVYKSHWRF